MTPEADSETGPAQRLLLAETFLQEAVYRSRGDQAGATLLSAGSASCGLGEKPSVVLDLSPRGEEIFTQLFDGADADELARIHDTMTAWVKKQDGLDRKRNHFLRDFRALHGSNRSVYDEPTLGSFEDGLARINAEVADARAEAAAQLLGPS